MNEPVSCELCGNEIDAAATVCPHCGSVLPVRKGGEVEEAGFRVVNLEKNMPTVAQALDLLEKELQLATFHSSKVLLVIHGYGSSGTGGAIKDAVRRRLALLMDKGEINDYLKGEDLSRRSGHCRHLIRRFPFLGEYIQRANPGVSLVVV